MMGLSPLLICIVFAALFIEGFFSGSELALLSADKLQLKKKSKQGDLGAQMALRLLQSPEKILSSTLLVTSTCVMATSVLLTLEFKRVFPHHAEVYAVLAGSGLVIIFGELIPKFIYRKFSSVLAPKVAIPIYYTQKVLSPFIYLASMYTSQISKVIRPIEILWSGKRSSAKDELQVLLTPDANETQIKSTEKRLIKKILKFRDKIAKDGLVPLIQVDAIDRNSSLQEAFELYNEKKHSRLPVFEERVDNIVGVLELSHIIRIPDPKQKIERFITPAFYISESQKLEDVLNEMMANDTQLAVVVDEYGGAVGILTREDIFEQIVGDLQDEDDLETRSIRELGPNKWVVRATSTIAKINEDLQLELPEGDYDTISGFLLRQFSRIPDPGDELFFDTRAGQIHFSIREASKRRIESVTIERIAIEQSSEET